MNTVRQKNEADQAVTDLIALCWITAGRDGDARDRVIEQQAMILRELARSSGLARSFIQQRVETMRAKRVDAGPELEIVQ